MTIEKNRGTVDHGCRYREGEAGHHTSLQGNATATPKVVDVFTKLERIAEMAHEDSCMTFKNLAHLMRPEFLYHCYMQLNKKICSRY